ncbi:MAG: hypothetical protein RI955_733 [Bacteroidota bacterium]
MKKIFFYTALIGLFSFTTINRIKPINHVIVDVLEPSDVCLAENQTNFYIAGNRGMVAKVDASGKALQSINSAGSDYEGILQKGNELYVLDETYRRVDIYDAASLKKMRSVYLHDNGGLNQSFEGITFIPQKKQFITVTEKPVSIHTYNEDLFETSVIDETPFKEASSITYHHGSLWLLSDEQMMVYQLNADNFSIINQWKIPVLNPEGICFDAKENLIILSDDRKTLYTFSPLNNAQ